MLFGGAFLFAAHASHLWQIQLSVGLCVGLGIALMPDYLALGLAGVRRVLPDSDGPMAECHLVYPEELRKSRRIADFRDFLLRELAAAKLA